MNEHSPGGSPAVTSDRHRPAPDGPHVSPNDPPSNSHWIPRQRGGTMPIPPRHFVPRMRLWERLDESTRLGVTLLTGPVGSGKTLGVAGWLQARGHDRDHAIWVHADASLDPRRLWAVLDQARGGPDTDRGSARGARLMVIDDAHELPAASLRMVDELLQEAPTSIRLLLVSRWDLPLTRLVPELLGHLTVLRGDVLRMSDIEATALVAPHLQKPDPDVVRAVVDWAHGWSAVLVLAAHAVGRAPEPAAAVRRLSAETAPVADQVASEVFATLTVAQRHLLLCLSGEAPFSARLAAHLSNDRNAGEILSELETTGLLVTRVPAQDRLGDALAVEHDAGAVEPDARFVIHPLLLEVVRRRLAVDSVDVARARATVTRAVRLDLARGHAPDALGRLVRLYAIDEAAAVLAREGVHMVLGSGHGDEVARVARDHPAIVEGHPSTWFAVALDRWRTDDPDGLRHWTGRILSSADQQGPASVACARLWRAKLGLEAMAAAMEGAQQVVAAMLKQADPTEIDPAVLPVLVVELGAAQAWVGELDAAASSFTTAMALCRSEGLTALATATMTHLALTEFMAGRDHAAAEVATEAFSKLGEDSPWQLRFAPSRAGLALFLSAAVALPWTGMPASPPFGPTGRRLYGSDLTARFWSRVRDAVLAAWSGSVASARNVLASPVDDPRLRDGSLPRHLRVVLLLGEALLAALSADAATLEHLESQLAALGATGESRFVAGLRADCRGDRESSVEAFRQASDIAVCAQPPVRAMSLACAAQLLDSLGETDPALDRLAEAAALTEVRRNGVAFLGWSRQGSAMEGLLRRLDAAGGSAWVHELAEVTSGRSDVISSLDSATSLRSEGGQSVDPPVVPSLSPREREVLGELARGATYADIGATLFLSANTVKTHVSSLYTKLGVSRRSEALSFARSHHIL